MKVKVDVVLIKLFQLVPKDITVETATRHVDIAVTGVNVLIRTEHVLPDVMMDTRESCVKLVSKYLAEWDITLEIDVSIN